MDPKCNTQTATYTYSRKHMALSLTILDQVSVTLAGRRVLNAVSLKLHEGDFVMLRGANGGLARPRCCAAFWA